MPLPPSRRQRKLPRPTHRDSQPSVTAEPLEVRRLLSNAASLAAGSAIFEFNFRLNTPGTLHEFSESGNNGVAKQPKSNGNSSVASSPIGGAVTQSLTGLQTTPQTYIGALSGKVVFTSGGHGWMWNTTLGRYATDRGDNNDIVEDFGNQEQMSFYADYVLRAGGTVVPMRPVGHQTNEVILDNDSAGVVFSGAWSNSVNTQYFDEDYGASADAIPYKFIGTVTGAATHTATYTPNIPQAGFYPVYTWVLYGSDRTSQTYTINHTGGSTEIKVDHSIVGSGWVYLGTYHFDAGSNTDGSVVINNKAAVTGKVVIADAIRFGNGMGDYIWTQSGATTVSTYSREEENSYHWIARNVGIGTSVSTVTGSTSSTANVSAPSNAAQYMYHGVFGGAVYVGFHSNAGGGRGARGLIDSSAPSPHQAGTNGLADILGDQVNQDMQALPGVFEFDWTTGTTSTFTGAFGEINLGASAEMDATIIEVAFHDDASDAAIMKDPKGREQIARSVYQGTLQYFSLYGSPVGTTTSAPTPPTTVRAVSNASGQVTINWAAGPTTPSGVYGNAATGYTVYTSEDGYGFDGGRDVAGVGTTNLTITGLDPTAPYYFKVASTNAGGESAASEVVAALPSGGEKQVLIVNGYDRFDRTLNFRDDYLGTPNTIDHVWPRYNNSFDYINRVETAIQSARAGTRVASTSNEAVISNLVNLTDYKVVIWISGNESTDDDTFDATEQTKITTFLNAGGTLFVSGSELGWDLDQQNNGRTFYENTLKGNYVADDAGTYTAAVDPAGIFSGLSTAAFAQGTAFSNQDNQVYDVAFPDVIAPQAGAVTALTYSGGTGGTSAIQAQGTGGKGNLVMFAFPFESMTNVTRRQQYMQRILDFLISDTPGTTVLVNDSGTPGDNLTKFNNSPGNALQFTVSGTVAGATVAIYDSTTPTPVLLGSAVAVGTSTTVTTSSGGTLNNGAHVIIARQTEPGKAISDIGATLTITIDATAPVVAIAPVTPDPRNTSVTSIAVNFSEAIAGFDISDLSLTRDGGGNLLTGSQAPTTGNNIAFTIPNLTSLTGTTGSYSLTLSAPTITDAAGNAVVSGATETFNVNVIDGDATPNFADAFRVTVAGPTSVNIFVNNNTATPNFIWSFSGQTLRFNGLGGNDSLSVTGEVPVDIVYNGGAQTSSDSLTYVGPGSGAATYAPSASTPGNGTITLNNSRTISFTGLEPVTMSDLAEVTLVTPNASDSLAVDTPLAGQNRITGSSGGVAFESLTFFNVATMIVAAGTNDGGGANDTLTVGAALGATGLTSFRFVGGTGSDTLNVNAGTLAFDSDAQTDTANLTLNVTGANVAFNSSQHLAALNIGAGGQASIAAGGVRTVVTKAIAIDPAGRLDISDNALAIDYAATDPTPLATIKGYILAGRNGTDFALGDWNGNGIMSSIAAAQDLISFAIGYADNSFLPQLGLPSYSSFRGQTMDDSTVLVRYTLGADTNLDGKVNDDDVTIVGADYNNPGTGDWYLGDFDYDGICNDDDVTVISAMYDPTSPPIP